MARNGNSSSDRRVDSDTERTKYLPFPVIGIGGSAGAVSALKTFFATVRPDTKFAFVVVQHLSPNQRSNLTEIIARETGLRVETATDDRAIENGHAYVIPPNHLLTVERGRLHLGPYPAADRTAIDRLLISLAEDQGENAACIILSGTGSDGTVGLRAIKEHGGLTLAQAGAEYDGMLHSALTTGMVDFVLPVEEMSGALTEFFDRRAGLRKELSEGAPQLSQVYALLRARTGHDFSGYKEKTVSRRVERRMQVLRIDDPGVFLDRLRREPREVDLLLQDLLIGVTSFFRDPPVFAAMENLVIPALFEGKAERDTIRVWVPGCATGEEAYSIAMQLYDHQPEGRGAPKLQIFASDIDEHALEVARTGRYPASIAKDMEEKRLKRYFTREDGTYRVVSELREACLFSVHNVLRDAPFSKLDLLSCRNLLIYLSSDLQNRLIPLFHYALRDGGYLVLGTSENVSRHGRYFGTVDKAHRIFQRRPVAEKRLPEFPLTAPDPSRRNTARIVHLPTSDMTLQMVAERQMLDRYSPAFVIVNEEGELLHVSDHTGKYLEFPAGVPNNNIFSMARRGLRLEIRALLHRAMTAEQPVVRSNVNFESNGERQLIDVTVQPLRASGQQPVYLVVFKDIGDIAPLTESDAKPEEFENATVAQLEAELRTTKERLQTTTEELESSNEELKSSNEELSSINEELQSANEELETSKEELQSINEELQTVNAELKNRVDELSRANSDIANLLESTQIATLFLNRDLAIKSFTPAAKDVFRLVESDAGRPLSHVRSRLRLDTVEEDAERVLRTLSTIEKQVDSEDGRTRYIMRVLPYRTVDNVIGGVVITFIDVTRVTAAEARVTELTRDLRERVESLRTVLDLVPVGVFIAHDREAMQVQVNRYGARLLGLGDEAKGPRDVASMARMIVDGTEVPTEDQPLPRAARTGEPVASYEGRLVRPDGSAVDVMVAATPLFDEAGQTRGAIAAMVDITQRKGAEAAQAELLHELQHRVKNTLAIVSSLATRMQRSNSDAADFTTRFLERLRAMAAVHELLSAENWQRVNLRDIAATATDAYDGADKHNITIRGPDVTLDGDTAATLSMALHELATNAAKYGALSVSEGHVELMWHIDMTNGGRWLTIAWRERNGPHITAPPVEGFGTGFVRRSVAHELGGTVELAYEPEGLSGTIIFPLDDRGEKGLPGA
jgi:two-component system, chemotaxis family, CheB/CheR fusion protein